MKDTKPTIESLRKSGYKVAVLHRTDETERRYTHIIITSPEKLHAQGFSFVHKADNFDRKIGNRIALGRALKNLANDELIPDFPTF